MHDLLQQPMDAEAISATSVKTMPTRVGRELALAAAVAIAYVAAARLGFQLAFVAEQITTVWAPTGIALAVLLLWGPRLWPAIWVGAFLANAFTDAPAWTALAIATGNTLESVCASWALRRVPGFSITFRRVGDAVAFLILAAGASTTISATLGVTALCAADVQPWGRFTALWFDWWLGDALGAVIVAPALLTAASHQWSEWTNALLYVGSAALVTHLVFAQPFDKSPHPLEYVIFPVAIAAAVSGGPAVTTLVALSASAVTIGHTVRGAGPFAGPEPHQDLVLLQVFMGVLAGTALLLAAAIAERRSAEQREKEAAAVLRHREELLRESRDVLSLAMRGGSMGAWSRNLATNEVWWSRELEEIVGLEPGAFSRTEAGFFELLHED